MAFSSFPIQTNPFASYAAAFTGTLTWGGGSSFTGFVLNSAVPAGSLGFSLNQTFSGSAVGQISFNQISITSDTAVITQGALATPLELTYTFGGGGMTGNRVGINVNMHLAASASDTIAGGGSYAAFAGQVNGQASCGGTGLTISTAKGGIQGANFIATLNSGATNMYGAQGCELDVNVESGATTYSKIGLAIVQLSTDSVQGNVTDTAISIVNQPSAGTVWNNGILLGRQDGQWPFGASSSLLSTFGSAGNLQYGIDLSAATVTTGGAMFLAPLITPSSSSATGKTGSIVWDSGFIYICTSTNTWKRAALSSF